MKNILIIKIALVIAFAFAGISASAQANQKEFRASITLKCSDLKSWASTTMFEYHGQMAVSVEFSKNDIAVFELQDGTKITTKHPATAKALSEMFDYTIRVNACGEDVANEMAKPIKLYNVTIKHVK